MAQGKKTFIFYSDWINMIKEMPDKDAGLLLKHILLYVNDEEPETKNILVKMAFAHMQPLLKSDLKKWEEIRGKRSVAGAKGGKQKLANAKQTVASAKQLEAVNDNVNVNNSSCSIKPPPTTSQDIIIAKHNEFLKECLTSHEWQSHVCRNTKIQMENIPMGLKKFNSHLIAEGEHKMNIGDYKKHFVSWTRIMKNKK